MCNDTVSYGFKEMQKVFNTAIWNSMFFSLWHHAYSLLKFPTLQVLIFMSSATMRLFEVYLYILFHQQLNNVGESTVCDVIRHDVILWGVMWCDEVRWCE